MPDVAFSTDWFSEFIPVWSRIFAELRPQKILEIGCFEGRSTCWMIETVCRYGNVQLFCLDTFQGSVEHQFDGVPALEQQFDRNTQRTYEALRSPHSCEVVKLKTHSLRGAAALLVAGHAGSFDLAYVDGSHDAHDVLADLVLSFALLRVGGVLIIDDYLWINRVRHSPLARSHPKPAVDAFTNLNAHRLCVLQYPLYQLYVQKLSD